MNDLLQFKIQDIALSRVNFIYNKDHEFGENEELPLSTNLNWRSKYLKKNNLLIVFLSVTIGNNNSLFVIDAEIRGGFKFARIPAGPDLELLSNVNCPALLFPYLREYVSDLTKRAGFSPLFLPHFNFAAAYAKGRSKK